ncbi:MAG TPA: NAD(P)H-dependent glycerol-3-phosphate dehydrogenase [Vicinamibacterales bacterium]|nr:NAD(P)H-dependent glycerol-3-phosphate dehydrogenase [Vicinamibacterales bacterium]
MTARLAILGAGSWGTALAVHAARIGHDVNFWGRDASLVDEIARTRENARYLPGIAIDARVRVTPSIEAALSGAGVAIAALPSHGMRHVLREASTHIPQDAIVVSAAKGLETDTLERMSQVIRDEVPGRSIAVLSGPSFAIEVARGMPTAVVVASSDPAAVARVQDLLRGSSFRLYASDDVTGVEFGGALKNVIAIAAGVVEGLGIGHNAMAALITRGLVEMSRLACAAGSRSDTLAGLSGLGDLVLTCTGDLSRNRHVGLELGRGRTLDDILGHMRMVAEGVRTTRAALALGARHQVELPLAAQMAAVLEGRATAREAVERLMLRPQRPERDSG